MKQDSKMCKQHGKVLATKTGSSLGGWHIFHFVMTFMTGLLWLPIWILCGMCDSSKWRCSVCGRVCK